RIESACNQQSEWSLGGEETKKLAVQLNPKSYLLNHLALRVLGSCNGLLQLASQVRHGSLMICGGRARRGGSSAGVGPGPYQVVLLQLLSYQCQSNPKMLKFKKKGRSGHSPSRR